MTETAQSCADEVQNLYTELAPGVDDVTPAAAQAVERVLTPALRGLGAGKAEGALALVATAMQGVTAAVKKSGDSVWHAARGGVAGVVHAAVSTRLELAPLIAAATSALVEDQLALDGDFAAAAKGAVQGAILASEELGLDPARAAQAAARAGLAAASAARKAAGIKVRHVLGERVNGYPTGLA